MGSNEVASNFCSSVALRSNTLLLAAVLVKLEESFTKAQRMHRVLSNVEL